MQRTLALVGVFGAVLVVASAALAATRAAGGQVRRLRLVRFVWRFAHLARNQPIRTTTDSRRPPLTRSWGQPVLLASFVMIAAAACGSAATHKQLALSARVIGRGEFKGYAPGSQMSFKTPDGYLAGSNLSVPQRKAWSARLTREGFEQDLTEFLTGSQGSQTGLSGVMQLDSDASARAELAEELRADEGQAAETFRVKAIPGAVGFSVIGSGEGGENILFADGAFLYTVGYGWIGNAHTSKHSALVDAATELYNRVHGRPAS
jgi:hypothetical protein